MSDIEIKKECNCIGKYHKCKPKSVYVSEKIGTYCVIAIFLSLLSWWIISVGVQAIAAQS